MGKKHKNNHIAETGSLEKKDDDMGFDLGKAFSFLKKKKASPNEHAAGVAAHEDSGKKKDFGDEEPASFDLSLDSRPVKAIFVILLLLIPILFSIHLRGMTADLPIADVWASNNVDSMIQSNIRQQIDAGYPNLPAANKQQIVTEEFQKIIERGVLNYNGQEVSIDEIKRQNAQQLREQFQRAEDKQTYLVAIDPYYYYRLTENYIENGYEQDIELESGNYVDTHILAGMPRGEGTSNKVSNLHVLVQAYIFKAVRLIKPDVTLMQTVFYTPLIIATLAIIPAFFIVRKIAGNVGGFFAGMLVALHPSFLSRTAAGFSDTDAYNVFFPLMILWFLVLALDSDSIKKSLIYTGLLGLMLGLFAFAWSGWLFMFNFVIVTLVAYLAYLLVVNREKIYSKGRLDWSYFKDQKMKNLSAIFAAFILSGAIFVSVFTSVGNVIGVVRNTIGFTQIKDVGISTIWPNVLTTVAELNPANLATVISNISLGSKVFLFLAFAGIVLSLFYLRIRNQVVQKSHYYFFGMAFLYYLCLIYLIDKFSSHIVFSALIAVPLAGWILYSMHIKEEFDIKYAVVLSVWFVATFYASSKGIRFILLLVPAYALAIGIAIGLIHLYLSDIISREYKINATMIKAVLGLILVSLLFWPTNQIASATTVAENEIPSMNDQWYATLTKIRQESEPDAIINSWWDFGHWFAAISDRAVTLDGGRQNNPAAHWLGKLMLTPDETESVGILRYLDCGSNTGFYTLLKYKGNDSLKTIRSIYDIIVLDRQDAKELLIEEGLTEEQAEEVLMYTHCQPPEDYFITSQDMVGKSGVWAHFGSWNFTRAAMYNRVNNLDETEGVRILAEEFELDQVMARRYYNDIQTQDPDQWISPWPGYGGSTACTTSNDIVTCQNGFVFNLQTEDGFFNVAQGQTMRPRTISFISKDGEFSTKSYAEDVLTAQNGRPLGVAVVPQGAGSYRIELMDDSLTASIFTRLFFFEGIGLEHFDMFHKVTDVTGAKIIVWKVDWAGESAIQPPVGQQTSSVFSDIDEADSFSQCLTDSGARFFGTQSCTFCNQQKNLLMNSDNIPYVDCEISTDVCEAEGIRAYPTWKIGAETIEGLISVARLSELTGCSLPGEEDAQAVVDEDAQVDAEEDAQAGNINQDSADEPAEDGSD